MTRLFSRNIKWNW